uniref:Uncharacterized protein n=1 Tax=Arundo donax TaxID=35708 RepID=A0A0A9BEU7_ARUDO
MLKRNNHLGSNISPTTETPHHDHLKHLKSHPEGFEFKTLTKHIHSTIT